MSNNIDCKKLRKQLKLTQVELSEAIGEEVSRIWLLENGFIHRVDPEAAERIMSKLQELYDKKELDSIVT